MKKKERENKQKTRYSVDKINMAYRERKRKEKWHKESEKKKDIHIVGNRGREKQIHIQGEKSERQRDREGQRCSVPWGRRTSDQEPQQTE
uniref:Uncharacterized protein n=1 Tax=Octopus bimaculoides TaxID=37653 RepID=A0A0L8G9M3_OCTBM